MKMPDFNVKKLVKEAGSTLSRVVQVNPINQLLVTQLGNILLNINKNDCSHTTR